MNPKDSINKANETLRYAQSLTAYLIAGAMSDYEPEQNEVQDLGFQLQKHLTAIDECLQALWEAAKAKPEDDKRITTPESDDHHKMLNISDEIDKIKDEELRTSLRVAYIKFYKPILAREFGLVEPEKPETPETAAATEGDQ